MKLYMLFIALVLPVIQAESEFIEKIRKIEMACREESQVTDADWDRLVMSGWNEEPKENLKCHTKCFMEKLGEWKDGVLDEDAAKKNLQDIPEFKDHPEDIEQTLADCKDKKGANDCDTAYLITKCFFEHERDIM